MLLAAAFSFTLARGPAQAEPPPHAPIYLVEKTSDAETVALTVSLYACTPDSVILFESANRAPALDAFVSEWQPRQVAKITTLNDVWRLIPKAPKVVVTRSEPRGQFLQAACLAGALALLC